VKLRHLPTIVDAVIWDGTQQALDDISALAIEYQFDAATGELTILTLEGARPALAGDVVIKGVGGVGYPIKPDIAAQSYEVVG
jgi:hypothetical protein